MRHWGFVCEFGGEEKTLRGGKYEKIEKSFKKFKRVFF